MTPIQVLLVEDDPAWQAAVETLLDSEAGITLAAVADHYNEAMAAYDRLHPDVVLLDWQICGERDGLMLGEALLRERQFPAERMILVTGSDSSLLPPHAFKLVPKSRIAHDLIYAIHEASATPAKR